MDSFGVRGDELAKVEHLAKNILSVLDESWSGLSFMHWAFFIQGHLTDLKNAYDEIPSFCTGEWRNMAFQYPRQCTAYGIMAMLMLRWIHFPDTCRRKLSPLGGDLHGRLKAIFAWD